MAKSALGLILLLAALPALAQRPQAELQCRPAKAALAYDCTIRLARDGKPLDGVRISVGADMPSMPMAHNMKPARAKPGTKPGEYKVRLELEMQGEWAVKLRLSGPVRDLLVVHHEFR